MRLGSRFCFGYVAIWTMNTLLVISCLYVHLCTADGSSWLAAVSLSFHLYLALCVNGAMLWGRGCRAVTVKAFWLMCCREPTAQMMDHSGACACMRRGVGELIMCLSASLLQACIWMHLRLCRALFKPPAVIRVLLSLGARGMFMKQKTWPLLPLGVFSAIWRLSSSNRRHPA